MLLRRFYIQENDKGAIGPAFHCVCKEETVNTKYSSESEAEKRT